MTRRWTLRAFDLQLDMRGTELQKAIWAALLDLERGTREQGPQRSLW